MHCPKIYLSKSGITIKKKIQIQKKTKKKKKNLI